ncbi:MAG: hypothetical protein CML46_12545 [Rhodobacteraceae bacterium]|nr:hypothetical protein [Paracoccaceae bacterium]MBR27757.1 hypothetical protein [Paracoccaceae bacterium]|tara:strand:- start:26 stop:427 length:402 start_codon:yes stop_codon:yes gene_type:complete
MTFSDSIQNVLLNFAEFRGRATRSEYWYWVLFALCLQVLFQIVDGLVSAPLMGFPPFALDAGRPISVLGMVALLPPTLAVGCRRLHDVGRSGWWLLLPLIPVIGALALLWMLTRTSVERDNRFGSSVAGLQRT